jgi:hypothetical protein
LCNPVFNRTETVSAPAAAFSLAVMECPGYSEIAGSGWRGGTSTLDVDSSSVGFGNRGGSGILFARKSHAAWYA